MKKAISLKRRGLNLQRKRLQELPHMMLLSAIILAPCIRCFLIPSRSSMPMAEFSDTARILTSRPQYTGFAVLPGPSHCRANRCRTIITSILTRHQALFRSFMNVQQLLSSITIPAGLRSGRQSGPLTAWPGRLTRPPHMVPLLR